MLEVGVSQHFLMQALFFISI